MLPHWEYFLALEDDLIRCARFVEFTSSNYSTYSLEFARLLLASSSEIDVVAKLLCKKISPAAHRRNIDDYRAVIISEEPKLEIVEIEIARYGICICPWRNWSTGNNPSWWRSYNNVKHERDMHFNEATLENTLYSICGLQVLLLYYYKHFFPSPSHSLSPSPRLLEPKWYGLDEPGSISWAYELPK